MTEGKSKAYPKLDPVPTTCSDCIKSKYKLPKPQCVYEQGLEHKKTYTYFKSVYSIPIPQHLESMQRLKRQRDVCLRQIQEEATKMITLRKGLGIDILLNKFETLNERIDDIENSEIDQYHIEDKDRILAAPHEAGPGETIKKKIIKPAEPVEQKIPEKHISKAAKDRGWLMYVRNIKKNKINEYVAKLKQKHPELIDGQIKITLNKAGNYMIRYTLNPNLAAE